MEVFRFANPGYLYLLLVIPLLIGVYAGYLTYRKRALKRFGNENVINILMPDSSTSRLVIKFIFFLLALGSIIIALARPQFGSKLQEAKRKGVELMIALDVSNSMMAEDIQPNRLERAKQAISKLIDKLRNDKIGLIVFAGDAYMQIPITTDYSAVKLFLPSIDPEVVPRQGTAIGSAIRMAMNSYSPGSELQKALIIITDGENHEDDPVQAAREAAEKGIEIYTLGMGLPKGAPVPLQPGHNTRNFRKDREGNVVITKLDEVTLDQIAAAGEGSYIRASNTNIGLSTLFDEINEMERKEYETRIYSDYDDKFQYFAGFALLILMIDFLVKEKKGKWLRRLNIYKVKI
ncbi:MAG: VWA domain-containing protein [Bacteroidota bacterium]